jgi:precorrin-4 methylase
VAVVCYAGDPKQQRVIRSTVAHFLEQVDYQKLPREMHTLVVGKFLTCGQARKAGVAHTSEEEGQEKD